MAVGFNVINFRAQIDDRGVQKVNKFLVKFNLPRILLNSTNPSTPVDRDHPFEVLRNMEFWCEAASYPGVGLNMHSVLRYGYGPVEKKPVSPIFTDAQLYFIADSDGANRRFFHEWINNIVNYDFQDGIDKTNLESGLNTFEVEYKKNYAVDIGIHTFDDAGNLSDAILLQEAYPILAGEVSLNWQDNSIMHFPVTFTFMNWYRPKI